MFTDVSDFAGFKFTDQKTSVTYVLSLWVGAAEVDFSAACQRLPLIVLAKLLLVCLDRFAGHVKDTETGSLSSTCFLQELLIHQQQGWPMMEIFALIYIYIYSIDV